MTLITQLSALIEGFVHETPVFALVRMEDSLDKHVKDEFVRMIAMAEVFAFL
jgi:hypothetical protein